MKKGPVACLIVLTVLAFFATGSSIAIARDVPYVPTPQKTVETMLEMADVGPGDVVYDLGSGDGRIVITAVEDFNAKKGVGVDIDPVRIRESEENAVEAGVTDRTDFYEGNVFTFDFSEADVLTMYLLQGVNERLRPRILNELEPGTRVVSHQFDMDDWEPDNTTRSSGGSTVHFWVVPAQVAGDWEWQANGETYRLELDQEYQKVSGSLEAEGDQSIPVRQASLKGRDFEFTAKGEQPLKFEGRVTKDDTIEGTMTIGDEQHTVVASLRE